MRLFCVSALLFLLILPLGYSSTFDEAVHAADGFVSSHGIFRHGLSVLHDVRIFRVSYSACEGTVSFLYMAFAYHEGRLIQARFLVTVNTNDMSISSVELLENENRAHPPSVAL